MASPSGYPARLIASIWMVALLSCSACAPGFQLAEDAPKSGDLHRLILLPMNFDRTPTASLAAGTERTGERIRSHLESKGYEVIVPKMSATLKLWKQCTESVGGIAEESGREIDEQRYAQARSELVRQTLASYPADAVVSSTILLREARYSGDKLTWDGVRRSPVIDMKETNHVVMYYTGTDVGVSLRTTLFDRKGQNVFERYVGLEPYRQFRGKGNQYQIAERTDLLQNADILEEGIALSFEPWLSGKTE